MFKFCLSFQLLGNHLQHLLYHWNSHNHCFIHSSSSQNHSYKTGSMSINMLTTTKLFVTVRNKRKNELHIHKEKYYMEQTCFHFPKEKKILKHISFDHLLLNRSFLLKSTQNIHAVYSYTLF